MITLATRNRKQKRDSAQPNLSRHLTLQNRKFRVEGNRRRASSLFDRRRVNWTWCEAVTLTGPPYLNSIQSLGLTFQRCPPSLALG